ncbi:MAG: methylmalonyl Co-A mutase-associated GTPase MeaB [Bacteroidetes bacterium]|nr:methylmalonyl Co-A mutase-associated GTPase MeaB [Bacteroidota bacterium]MDA1336745.1 methylmalonyl Co-A mutase-associated GTPase MeaB [Bacteroidota bacterium]
MSKERHDKKSPQTANAIARDKAKQRIQKAQLQHLSPKDWALKIAAGHREALSRAITLTESQQARDIEFVNDILQELHSQNGPRDCWRIGITGVPGVGKSTFIEELGMLWAQQQLKIAVLAIDPSSGRSGGSLLGDKTRMTRLANHPNAFIRPSPTADSLGGVTRGTYEAILLCEAAGYDRIIVETVGVGQSETDVRQLTDVFLLLMLPGGGDELQGMKRGIMEMADMILVNKADIDEAHAQETAHHFRNAIHLFPPHPSGHELDVQVISALSAGDLTVVSDTLKYLMHAWLDNDWFETQRSVQRVQLFERQVQRLHLMNQFARQDFVSKWNAIAEAVKIGKQQPLDAALKWNKATRKINP